MSRLREAFDKLGDVWISLQVELHGQYSIRRLESLHRYCRATSWKRVVSMCILTPLPCLVLVVLTDLVPLSDPKDGLNENYVFWIRNWVAVAFITLAVLEQFRNCLPRLPISNKAMAAITVVATSAGVGFQYMLAYLVGFPFPFSLVVGSATWTPAVVTGCYMLWGQRLRQDETLRQDLSQYLVVFGSQLSLTYIYPLYIYVFNSLSSRGQTAFVLVLPVIKITMKNSISRFLKDVDDLKPEVVIFNIEIFNALYVSCSMQNSTSSVTSVVIMTVDAVQAWLSVVDINHLLGDITKLVAKLPGGKTDELHQRTIMDICMEMLRDPQVRSHPHLQGKEFQSLLMKQRTSSRIATAGKGPKRPSAGPTFRTMQQFAAGGQVAPIAPTAATESRPTEPTCKSGPTLISPFNVAESGIDCIDAIAGKRDTKPDSLLTALAVEERVEFVKITAQVLFVTEFVVLIEFTEVIIPIIYSMYMVAMSHLPNRQYYPQLAKLSNDRLAIIIRNVLIYSLLEFISFVAITIILKRKLKISSMHQLAFVLDKHMSEVQSKLILWTFYVVQSMLFHFGVDFSLKFVWLMNDRDHHQHN